MSDSTDKAGKTLRTAWGYTKIYTLNTLRRGLILGRYSLICWQQQKLRCALQKLGAETLKALDAGEVNPLLTEAVKDALERARAIKAVKDRHYQAVDALREKIATACACEFPAAAAAPPPEPPPEEPRSEDPGPRENP